MLDKIPDYTEDLNAMHEAEKTSGIGFNKARYVNELRLIAEREGEDMMGFLLFASAKQRAEAFLKTLGQWIE